MRNSAVRLPLVLAIVLLGHGVARGAVLVVAAGQTVHISGTHVYDSVDVHGRLELTGPTSLHTDYFRLAIGGWIYGSGNDGGDGSNGQWQGIGNGYALPQPGGHGQPGNTFSVTSSGTVILNGHVYLDGGDGGNGGSGALAEGQTGARGGHGGSGGSLLVTGRNVDIRSEFQYWATGGDGGDGGSGSGLAKNGGNGGNGGFGGSMFISYHDTLIIPTSPFLVQSGGVGGLGGLGSAAVRGSDGSNGNNGKITITPIPEPASIGLLVAGALALVRRRQA